MHYKYTGEANTEKATGIIIIKKICSQNRNKLKISRCLGLKCYAAKLKSWWSIIESVEKQQIWDMCMNNTMLDGTVL